MVELMPAPSSAYLAAPEVGRSRLTAQSDSTLVVVENFSTAEQPCGVSVVRISRNGGQTFEAPSWCVHWASFLKKLGREWPPHSIETVSVAGQRMTITYCEATYDGPVDRAALFDVAAGNWRLV
jgi:hypothetical protein